MSSGLVSQRTRITSYRLGPRLRRVRVEDGVAGRRRRVRPRGPSRRRRRRRFESSIGWRRWSSCAGSILAIASPRLSSPSSTIATAAFTAGGGRPLGRPGLEEVQPTLLHGELDVLDVAVVPLQPLDRLLELVVRGRERGAHLFERDGESDPRHDVLALRVQEELAADAALARRGVAAEADAGPAVFALVAEHHLHHVHGGSEVVGDLVGVPVHACPRRVPRVEHGAARRASAARARPSGKACPTASS